jgi:hypothetical protein
MKENSGTIKSMVKACTPKATGIHMQGHGKMDSILDMEYTHGQMMGKAMRALF